MKSIAIGLAVLCIGGAALGAAPAEGQKGVLIVFASRYGSTEQTAKWIAEGLGGKATVVAAKDAGDVSGYEKWILGSGIYGSQLHADMIAFLEKNAPAVKGKLAALFVVCGMPPDQAGGYLEMFAEKCGAKPLLARAFQGWMKKEILSPEDYEGLENYFKNANYPFENYDNTDKARCLAFAKEILEKLYAAD